MLLPWPPPEALAQGQPQIKKAAVILDFVDNSIKHKLLSVPSLFGLRPDFDLKGGSVTEALKEIESAQEQFKQLRLDSFRDLQQMRAVTQMIDLLKPPVIPPELNGLTGLTWFSGPGGSYQIVSPGAHFSIRENQLGQFELSRHENGLRRALRGPASPRDALYPTAAILPASDMPPI